MNLTAIGSVMSAFVIGCASSGAVALIASQGKTIDVQTIAAVLLAGALTAAKDYRSLMRLPPTGHDTNFFHRDKPEQKDNK